MHQRISETESDFKARQRAYYRKRQGVQPATKCGHCAGDFVAEHAAQLYCTATCKHAAKHQRQRADGSYERKKAARREVYARQLAAGEVPRDLARSIAYQRARGVRDIREMSTAGPCSLAECSQPILAKKLCYRHYRAAQRAAGVEWARSGAGRGGHKGRAKRHGVPHEPINHTFVFERDAWTCGICHEPVDPALKAPDYMSPSLDHVVSMSNGGGHLYSNVQCAHLICNIRKGAND